VLVRRRPTLALALLVLALSGALAVCPSCVAPADPVAIDADRILAPPGPGHWLGTDEVGRDVLSRVIHGTRPSVLSSLVAVVAAAALGSLLGLVAASGPRRLDGLVMRAADMLLAFPLFILAMGIVAALGRGLGNAILAAVIVWWPQYARLIRSSALAVREQAYVEGARALGASWWAILVRHVAPNSLSPVLTKASVDAGYMLLVLSGLSFIGLGAQPPSPEWGAMVTAGRTFVLSHWWYVTFPGLAIFLVSVAWNVTGEALRDLWDPHGVVGALEHGEPR
jgi:peptide/nickel transport system permease protein